MRGYKMTDEKLCIRTGGIQLGNNHSYFNHRYEPTSYEFLDYLFNEYQLSTNDTLVDFGCGKGRLNFYVNYRFHCNTIGIELNATYYEEAIQNLITYNGASKQKIHFKCMPAQSYTVSNTDNHFYFFNPFSIEIFRQVISNIIYSIEHTPRICNLILYYADAEYIYYLENYTLFKLVEEIKLPHTKDDRDCFYIYTNPF